MKITVKRVHAPTNDQSLRQAAPGEQETAEPSPVEVPAQATVSEILDSVGVRRSDVGLILVNGVERDFETQLNEGDAVAIVGRVAEM